MTWLLLFPSFIQRLNINLRPTQKDLGPTMLGIISTKLRILIFNTKDQSWFFMCLYSQQNGVI